MPQPRYHTGRRRLGHWRIDVYWRDDDAGAGPCASVYVLPPPLQEIEVLRMDCFPGDAAHCHVGGQRWYLPPGSMAQRIEWAGFHLRRNLAGAAAAAGCAVPVPAMEDAAAWLEATMATLWARYGPRSGQTRGGQHQRSPGVGSSE